MSETLSASPPLRFDERIVGVHEGVRPGRTHVIMGGVHGNEPAGLLAARRVLDVLGQGHLPVAGRIVVLAGNLGALAHDRRFLSTDLNRGWREPDLARLLAADPSHDGPEDRERRDLLEHLANLEASSDEPLLFLDLHTTSGPSAPFMAASDTLRNREVMLSLPIPVLLGLEEAIGGTLMGFLSDRGHVSMAIEAGQHDRAETVDRHESALWMWLAAARALSPGDIPDGARHVSRLAAASRDLPLLMEIVYRHAVAPDDEFVMDPGWESFQDVEAGRRLAVDRTGPIEAPAGGFLLMPLYQAQGDDGFFISRSVRRHQRRLQEVVRRLRLDLLLPLLPGLRGDAERPDHLVADASTADGRLAGLLRLFGYRSRWVEGERVIFARRRPNFRGVKRRRPDDGRR